MATPMMAQYVFLPATVGATAWLGSKLLLPNRSVEAFGMYMDTSVLAGLACGVGSLVGEVVHNNVSIIPSGDRLYRPATEAVVIGANTAVNAGVQLGMVGREDITFLQLLLQSGGSQILGEYAYNNLIGPLWGFPQY